MKALAWLVVSAALTLTAIRRLRSETHLAWPCAVRGHNYMLSFAKADRLGLRCGSCGHETPSWVIGPEPMNKRIA